MRFLTHKIFGLNAQNWLKRTIFVGLMQYGPYYMGPILYGLNLIWVKNSYIIWKPVHYVYLWMRNYFRFQNFQAFNRYKRGLEACPQANLHQSGRDYFLRFFFRRVRATSMTQRRVENTRVHFGANSPVSVKIRKLKVLIIGL